MWWYCSFSLSSRCLAASPSGGQDIFRCQVFFRFVSLCLSFRCFFRFSVFLSFTECVRGTCRIQHEDVCLCVLHPQPLSLSVDIQHDQSPCRFFTEIRTSSVVTELRHRYTIINININSALLCSEQGRRCNVVSSHRIRQIRHTRSMEERKAKEMKQVQSKAKRKKGKDEKMCAAPPPRRRCGRQNRTS